MKVNGLNFRLTSVETEKVKGKRKALRRKLLAFSGMDGEGFVFIGVVLCEFVVEFVKESWRKWCVVVLVLVEEQGGNVRPGGIGIGGDLCAAGQTEIVKQEIAEMGEGAGFLVGDESFGGGARELGEESADPFGRNKDSGRHGEFAGEVGAAQAAVRREGVRVAESEAFGMRRECAAASAGKGALASGEGGFNGVVGTFRSHAGRIILCAAGCLVTVRYMQIRMAAGSVRMGARGVRIGRINSSQKAGSKKWKTQDPGTKERNLGHPARGGNAKRGKMALPKSRMPDRGRGYGTSETGSPGQACLRLWFSDEEGL